MSATPVVLAWSGGKDCSYALHLLQQQPQWQVVGLLTTIHAGTERVNMHGLPLALVQAQAQAAGLPLYTMPVPNLSNEAYTQALAQVCNQLQQAGIGTLAFGDIFLPDLRAWRDEQLQALGMQACYPLWQQPTHALLQRMTAAGFSSTICCVDTRVLPAEPWLGHAIDDQLLHTLPAGVDPCGEQGEYHSFCYSGPIYQQPIPYHVLGRWQPLGLPATFDHFAWLDVQAGTA